MKALTETQLNGLRELGAVHLNNDWVDAHFLSGTKAERSAANFRRLMALGLVEGKKDGTNRQGQWRWRITEAGRQALAQGQTP
jgi:hypothetical protein